MVPIYLRTVAPILHIKERFFNCGEVTTLMALENSREDNYSSGSIL